MFVYLSINPQSITVKKKLLLSTFSLLAAGIMFLNCKGEDGAVGPAGAKGDNGTQGVAGAKGDKGDAGTANVIYSEWLPIPAPSGNTPNRKNFAFTAPKLTQEILDKGHVYAYLKHNNGTTYAGLPYASKFVTATGEITGSYLSTILTGVGGISLNQDWLTPGTIASGFSEANGVLGGWTHLRYVIVPGGTAARVASVDNSNYEAVKAYYNLPD